MLGLLDPAATVPANTQILGDGLNDRMTSQVCIEAAAILGVDAADLDTPTVLDAAWRIFGELADPTGVDRVKPIMPGRDGFRELHLGGLVKREPFTWGIGPEFSNVRAVVRQGFAIIKAEDIARGSDHYKRVGGGLERKYGKPLSEILGYPEESLPPKTIFVDTFVEPDNDTALESHTPTGTPAGTGWTKVDANGIMTVKTATDRLLTTANYSTFPAAYRLNDALGSVDHFAQIEQTVQPGDAGRFTGPCVRFAASAETFYHGLMRQANGDADIQMNQAGTNSNIALGTWSPTWPSTVKLDISGTSLDLLVDGVSKTTVTHTDITTGVHVGIATHLSDGVGESDGFLCDDGISAAGILPFANRNLLVA